MKRLCLLLTLFATQAAFGKTVSNVAISPQGAVLQAGSSQQFTVVCTYSDLTTDNCAAAGGTTWSSSLLQAMTVDASGLATWVIDPGANTYKGGFIVVAAGGVTDRAGVFGQHPGDVWTTFVTPDPDITTENQTNAKQPMSIAVGSTVALGYGFQINGSQNNPLQNSCTWSSSNPSVATVNRIGDVTAVAPGSVTLTCGRSGDGVYGTSQLGRWIAPGNVITLAVVNGGTGNQTWYVRPDGGLPYTNATDTPKGQCDGKHDAPYPGSGVNQPCAMGNLRYLWSNEVGYINLQWMISGGDTVIVRQNPAGYNVGGDAGGLPGNCYGNPFDCYMPTIPSGTATGHTRILGENYANCTADALKTKLMVSYGGYTGINVKDSQFVDTECFDISDRAGYGRGNFTVTPPCPGGSVDCGGAYGILESALTASVNYKNLIIHGLVEAIHGATGVGVVADHVQMRGNSSAGIDMDDDPFGVANISVAGGFTLTNSTIAFSGCIEEYPVVHNYPYVECRDQSTGGYGDGFGTASTSGDWIFDRDVWFANFQDGLDLLHSGMHTLSVTNSQSIANDGQAYKIGSGDNIIFRNNIAVVNCARILYTFGDEPASAIVPGVSPCRAAGDGLLFNFTDQGTYQVQDNSIAGYDSTLFDLGCEGGWDYCSNAATTFQNNLIIAYATSLDGGDGRQPGLFYSEKPTMPLNNGWAIRDHNFYYGVRYCPDSIQASEICNTASPGLAGLPTSPVVSPLALDNFNFMPMAASPLSGAGLPLTSILTDITGLLRPNPPAIGAMEFAPTNTMNVSQVTLTATPLAATIGQTVTLIASVASVGSVAPTGSVTFTVAGTTLGTAALNSSGVATISTSSLAAGGYQVIANYAGDTGYTPSASLATSLTVGTSITGKTTPQVALTLSSSSIGLFQPVTLTASVAATGGVAPTGIITFSAAGIAIGSAAVNDTGVATFTTSSLLAGVYSVVASYAGDGTYSVATSNSASLTVGGGGSSPQTASTVSLSLSANPISPLQPVTFTVIVASVGGVVPTGSVTFSVAGLSLGTVTLNSVGVATMTTSTLTAGNYVVTASYSGDGAYPAGTSNPVSLGVGTGSKTAASVALTLSATNINPLQQVTFTATVATVAGVVPTGTITFYASGVSKGSIALNNTGSVTVSVNTMTTGTYLITAIYSGDSGFTSGTSNGVTLIVGGGAPTRTASNIALGLSANPISALQPVTFTATVATVGGKVPTGSITFLVGGLSLGTVGLNGSGVATISTSSLTPGTYAVTASYLGDSNYTSGMSNTPTLTVNSTGKTAPILSLNLSSSTITALQPVTFTVFASTVGGVVPTGAVNFSAGGVTLGTAALGGSGVATFTTSSLAAGTYSIAASYAGDSTYSAGTSNVASLTVNPGQSAVSLTVAQPEFGFNVIPGSIRRVFATVGQGSTGQVTWSVKSGTATLSSNNGSWIDVTAPPTGSSCSISVANGSYSVTSSTQFTVEATSVDDATQKSDVTFNVCNPAVQVSAVPFYRTVYAKQAADIQSLITGSVNQNVHWAITSKPLGGDGTLGDTTSRDTVFAATVPGRYQLTAISQADPSKTATAIIYVTGNTIPYAVPVTPNQTEPVDCSVDPTMSGTVYDVGPSQAFKTLASVPFPTMTPGSTVRLHNEDVSGMSPTEYHEYVQLSRAGTATQPIRICGVPDMAGNQPIIDGAGATGRSDTSSAVAGLGLLTLHTDNNQNVFPNFTGAAYIAVEGIHFRNAKSGYNYLAPNGSTGAWGTSSACVRVNQGQNLAFTGNDFDNCGDGVYSAWNGQGGWGSSDLNVLWEGNHLHNNGVANSSNSHQMYLEAWGEVVQFNRIDNYATGGLGANLKSRGVQGVIRYNYFGDGPQRQMDLVDVTDAPTYMSFSGFLDGGANSYHALNPTDAYTADQLAAMQETWNSHYAYGNIYQNSVSTSPIHFAMDTYGDERARKGSLYWYNNTFNEAPCASCSGKMLTLFDTSAGDGNYVPQVEFPTVQLFNNIIWLAEPTQPAFQWNGYDAFIGVSGANLLTANWGTNNTAGGTGSGWNTTSSSTDYQGAEKLSTHVTGFDTNLTTATSIPFNAVSWALSVDLPGNQATPNAVCEMPTRFAYMPSLGYALARIPGPNMGATDTVAEAASELTSIVGAKQFNTHYSNCR